MFKRQLSSTLIEGIRSEKLFQERLLPDIKVGTVFCAVRNKRIDFYHKGGKVFTYDGEFKTHIKYASVYRIDKDKNYVSQEDLIKPKTCDFIEDYKRIKENCALYAGVESHGVSCIYSQYSYVKAVTGASVLDIEISFESSDEEQSQDRIDLLLLNNGTLQFYEAKHFSNGEIWAKPGAKPKVVDQLIRYHKQIEQNKGDIIEQYGNYVKIVNKVFDLNIGLPEAVDYNTPLLVFGFDRDQLQGRFKTLFEGNLKGLIRYYPIGDISRIQIDNMWKSCNS